MTKAYRCEGCGGYYDGEPPTYIPLGNGVKLKLVGEITASSDGGATEVEPPVDWCLGCLRERVYSEELRARDRPKGGKNPYGDKSDLLYLDSDIGEVGKAAQIDAFNAGMRALMREVDNMGIDNCTSYMVIPLEKYRELRRKVLDDECIITS